MAENPEGDFQKRPRGGGTSFDERWSLRIKFWRIIFTRASRIGWSTLIVHWWIQLKILSQIKKNERISHTWHRWKKTFCSANRTKRILRISKLNDRDMMKNICQGKFGKKYSRIGRNGQKCGKRADISTSTVGEARLNGSRAYISSEHMRSVARVATFWRVEQRRNGVIWSYGLARIP